ncbi:hypothetical protein [Streptomyces sp. NPDC086023]|uniref:hypothetical protein n=1 Tax=Streptomyces sp. NPDC086023 TaxID=3365746 RepID=UPI0037D38804
MTRTTPPRPFDVTAALPRLAPLARTATRLHPRAGSPSPHDSSVGGPLLWPAGEPWPHCDLPHVWDQHNPALSPDDIRTQRHITSAAARRAQGGSPLPHHTPEETAAYEQAGVGRPWPRGPVPMLPVAQVYARDVPLLRPPGPADLLQVLWCPFDHPTHPRTAVFWRTAAAVTDVLAAPPEPPAVQFSGYLPQPCLLTPEQVIEYPHATELGRELHGQVQDCPAWPSAGAECDGEDEPTAEEFYNEALSVAPGWKVGGWTRWGLTDPRPRPCRTCGTELVPLLTIASSEWDDTTDTWTPYQDRAGAAGSVSDPSPAQPTMIQIADGYDLQLYACPADPEHPHLDLVQ